MFFLALSLLALLVSTQLRSRRYVSLGVLVAFLFYAPLIAWILFTGGVRIFRGGEAGLLGWFVAALAVAFVGHVLRNWRSATRPWGQAAVPVAAVLFALGFDVLRPDAYSYVPAAILAAMILAVSLRAFLRLLQASKPSRNPKSKIRPERAALRRRGIKNRKSKIPFRPTSLIYVLAIALLVYSSTFKVIDRGWPLPWNYLAAAGGLLVGVAQLWAALPAKKVPAWAAVAAGRLGELLLVVSAVFIYREFL